MPLVPAFGVRDRRLWLQSQPSLHSKFQADQSSVTPFFKKRRKKISPWILRIKFNLHSFSQGLEFYYGTHRNTIHPTNVNFPFLFYCVHWCFTCLPVCGWVSDLWIWSCRQLWMAMWLGTEPGSSGRGACFLYCWAIAPAHTCQGFYETIHSNLFMWALKWSLHALC